MTCSTLSAIMASGLRAGSGFTVGLLGAAIGIHWSLGLSSAALCVGTVAAGWYALRRPRHQGPPETMTVTTQRERL